MKISNEALDGYHHTVDILSTKIRGAEVLNLLSILEVAKYLSCACVFHKKNAYRKTETQAKKWFSYWRNVYLALGLLQTWANYGPWATSGPLYIPVLPVRDQSKAI